MEGLPLTTTLVILANWLALAVASGLIFVVLLQPRRERINHFFAFFCFSVALWAFTSLMGALPEMRFGLSMETVFYLSVTTLALTALSFFFFVGELVSREMRLVRWLMFAALPLFATALLAIWSGQAFGLDTGGETAQRIAVRPLGYLLLALAVGYLSAGWWVVYRARQERTAFLYIPALLLVIAYASNALDVFRALPFDTMLITVATVWVGWGVLHIQLFNPFKILNENLRAANTDLKRVIDDLEAEKSRVEQLNTELQSTNRYKSDFLANMSHELRTPLNSILGYSELLMTNVYGALTDKQLDRLEKIHRNGKRLLELINDMLDLNKIEAGHLALDIVQMQPSMIVEEVSIEFEPLCQQKGLRFESRIGEHVPVLYGDRHRVRQVISNLVENAIKFTPEGLVALEVVHVAVVNGKSADVELPTIGWLQDGGWILFTVRDTGIGIDPSDQGKIFEQFAQVDNSRTREYEGTGLGLAIAKRLVEMHGGVIWLKSRPGQGSTFYVALPTEQNMPSARPVKMAAGKSAASR